MRKMDNASEAMLPNSQLQSADPIPQTRALLTREYTRAELFDEPKAILIAAFLQGPDDKFKPEWNTNVLKTILQSGKYAEKKVIVISL